MADKKKKEGTAPASAPEPVGAAGDKPKTPPKSIKIPKLAKKNKSRVPRKQKKAQQKASQAAARK
jgi:outer membrane biosynthesis protein TonB